METVHKMEEKRETKKCCANCDMCEDSWCFIWNDKTFKDGFCSEHNWK